MKRMVLKLYWMFTRSWLRFRGARLGRRVRCNGFPFVKVCRGGQLALEDDVKINAARWANAHVAKGSTNLFVGAGASLVLRRGSGISGCRVVAMKDIEIGEDSLLGGGCLVCDSDMHEVPLGGGGEVRVAPIRIGKRVFVGAGSIILKGVTIGDGAVVGAGSVVSRDVPPGAVVAGNPARVVRGKVE